MLFTPTFQMETSSGPKGASTGASFTIGRLKYPVAVFSNTEWAIAYMPKFRLKLGARWYYPRVLLYNPNKFSGLEVKLGGYEPLMAFVERRCILSYPSKPDDVGKSLERQIGSLLTGL